MEKKYDLLLKVFTKLQENGVLKDLIIVGSWCQFYYKILFDDAPEIPLIRTTDIDILIPNPQPKFKKDVDVSQLLNSLGFDNDFDYNTGLVKYEHPDFEIQFLTPEKGRGKTPPCYEIKKLNVNAEGLRFIEILQKYKMSMTYDNIVIQLPEPEAYALHKILISQKRKDDAKKEKDLRAGIAISELCMEDKKRCDHLKMIFDEMPKKWKKEILSVAKEESSKLFFFLNLSNEK